LCSVRAPTTLMIADLVARFAARVELACRVERQQAAGLDLGSAVEDEALQQLLVRERAAEGAALVQAPAHEVEGALRLSQPAHAVIDAAGPETLLRRC